MTAERDRIDAFARWVIGHRWWVIAVVVLFASGAFYGARYLRLSESYRAFFGPDNPHLQNFNALEKRYGRIDNAYFAVAPEQGGVFTVSALSAVEDLTRQAWLLPYAVRVESITNYQHIRAEGDDIFIGDLVPDARALPKSDLESIRATALSDPTVLNRLVNAAGTVAGINVSFQMPDYAVKGEWNLAATQVRALAEQIERDHPGVSVYTTGFVMLNNAFRHAALNDIKLLMPLMYAGVFVVVLIFFRSWSATFASMLIVGLSTATAFGAAGWLRYAIIGPTIAVGPLVMTLAVADSIHILVTIQQGRVRGLGVYESIVESLRINAWPEFVTFVMTSIGLLSMNFSYSPPLHDVGNITTIGVGAAYGYSMLLLPALASLLPIRAAGARGATPAWAQQIAEFVIRRRRSVLLGSIAAVGVLCSMIPLNELDERLAEYFDESMEFRRDGEFIITNMGGAYIMEFSIDSGRPGGIADPAYLEALDGFAQWLRTQPGVANVVAVSDVLKRLNRTMHGDAPDEYRIPAEPDLAAQCLLLYEMSLPPGLDLNYQIDVAKQSSRVVVTTDVLSSNRLHALADAATRWLRNHALPSMAAEASGSALLFAHLTELNIREMVSGTLVSILLIAGAMILALRSVRLGLLSLVPNLIPSAVAFGVWGLFVGYVSFALSTVCVMTLGIIVDDTVHLFEHYARARRRGDAVEDSIRHAFASVGTAVLATTITLCAGFLILSLSSFTFNRDMALLSAIVIACAFAADVLLSPALLLFFDRKGRRAD